ncbi:MAG: DUF4013 domain-containing protein [Thermomicrobiales bacterium]
MMGLDIGKAFTFVTDDPKWVTKVLIGGGLFIATLVLLLTVIGWIFVAAIIAGYLIQLARNVINGEAQVLPEWDNWGVKMTDGFKVIVVGIVYALPTILISLVFTVPSTIMSASGSSGVQATGSLLGLLGGCLNFFVGIAVALVSPIALARYASTSNLTSAFQFGEVFGILRQNIGMYIIVALLTAIVLQLVAGIGLIACFVGVFFTGFYAEMVAFHLYDQAYRAAQGPSMSFGTPAGARPF